MGWLRDRDDPDTIAYLEAENALRRRLVRRARRRSSRSCSSEIKSRVQETDLSAPVRKGDWWYSAAPARAAATRSTAAVVAPTTATDAGAARRERRGRRSTSSSRSTPSTSARTSRLLAWSADIDGGEHYTLRVRDLATGTDLADVIDDTTWGGTAWSNDDGRSVLRHARTKRCVRTSVWRHGLGRPRPTTSGLRELDERFYVDVDLTRSGDWIVIDVGEHARARSR